VLVAGQIRRNRIKEKTDQNVNRSRAIDCFSCLSKVYHSVCVVIISILQMFSSSFSLLLLFLLLESMLSSSEGFFLLYSFSDMT